MIINYYLPELSIESIENPPAPPLVPPELHFLSNISLYFSISLKYKETSFLILFVSLRWHISTCTLYRLGVVYPHIFPSSLFVPIF